jgi:hypothetical protein
VIDLIEIIFMIPVIVSILLAYRYLVLKRHIAKLANLLLQAEADKDLLKKQILQTIEDKKLVESEEFMMFLSKSREAAFSYIEDAQLAVSAFDRDVKKILFESTVPKDTANKILEANNNLQKLLPDNIKNNKVQGEQ